MPNQKQPLKKKAKIGCGDDPDDPLAIAANTAWGHYRNYQESLEENEEGDGDTDELEELLSESVLQPFVESKTIQPLQQLPEDCSTLTTIDLLPILISVTYFHLADIAIGECLEYQQSQENVNKGDTNEEQQELIVRCQTLIEKSLHWYPQNASMWSMGANFGRMFQVLSPECVCQWYERAVECASGVRKVALQILEDRDDDDGAAATTTTTQTSPEVKEWIELLLMNHITGVEYECDGDDDDEEEENDDEMEVEEADVVEKPNKQATDSKVVGKKRKSGDQDDDDDEGVQEGEEAGDGEEGYFSTSSVEATSRFMAAMLHSTAGRQEVAKSHLEHFPVTHRVHPSIWQPPAEARMTTTDDDNKKVAKYVSPGGGIIPTHLYDRLCQVFAPDAAYWQESDYNHRGYYSYYMDKPTTRKTDRLFIVTNLMDDIIWNHLYPRIIKHQRNIDSGNDDTHDNDKIVGAEWWIHTRAIQANLGHNLHFDTDEALLAQESQITHPRWSSVLYLTGGELGGATVVFDQTPDSNEVANKAWRCTPEDNTLMVFDGKLLHGVLPCPGKATTKGDNGDNSAHVNTAHADGIQQQWIRPKNADDMDDDDTPHRLTLLVGFWTRRVPDKMKTRKLYGPCGPLPPRPLQELVGKEQEREELEQHTWVEEIHQGYDEDDGNDFALSSKPPALKRNESSAVATSDVPVIAPAWETLKATPSLTKKEVDDDESSLLQIPRGIDHRFFVKNAPKCFRDSLFEKNDDCEEEEHDDDVVVKEK